MIIPLTHKILTPILPPPKSNILSINNNEYHMNRRYFLHLTGCTIAAGMLAAGGCGSDNQPSAESTTYPLNELIGVYAEQMPYYRAALKAAVDGDTVDPVIGTARVEFINLAPAISYVGPLQYPLPKTLAESGAGAGAVSTSACLTCI